MRRTCLASLPLALLACSGYAAPPVQQQQQPGGNKPFVETVVADFDSPWAMTFLPDGRLLVTEKKGTMLLVSADGKQRRTIATVAMPIRRGRAR